MMYLAHMICKRWMVTPMRYRFFITYSIFWAIFYAALVTILHYHAYGFNEVQTLVTIVLWNYYVLSLQYAWGKSETARNSDGGEGQLEFQREDGERAYFDSRYDVEYSREVAQGVPDLANVQRQAPTDFRSQNEIKLHDHLNNNQKRVELQGTSNVLEEHPKETSNRGRIPKVPDDKFLQDNLTIERSLDFENAGK